MANEICKNCSMLGSKNEALEKQVGDLVRLGKNKDGEIEILRKNEQEFTKTIKNRESQDFFSSLKGKKERYSDFQKLSADNDEYSNWNDRKKEDFVKDYPFLFKTSEKLKVEPNTIRSANPQDAGAKPDKSNESIFEEATISGPTRLS